MPTLSRVVRTAVVAPPPKEELPLLQQAHASDVDPRFLPRKRRVRRLFASSSSSSQRQIDHAAPPKSTIKEHGDRPKSYSHSCTPIPSRFARQQQRHVQSERSLDATAVPQPSMARKESAPTLLIPSLPENPHDSTKKYRPFPVPTRRSRRGRQGEGGGMGEDPPESSSNSATTAQQQPDSKANFTQNSPIDAQPSRQREPHPHQEQSSVVSTKSQLAPKRFSLFDMTSTPGGSERTGTARDAGVQTQHESSKQASRSYLPFESRSGEKESNKRSTNTTVTTTEVSTLGDSSISSNPNNRDSRKERASHNNEPDGAVDPTSPDSSSSSSASSNKESDEPRVRNAALPNYTAPPSPLRLSTANKYQPAPLVPSDPQSHSKLVKEVLSRPFGRQSLGKLARQYCVTINPAELEEDGQWKYRVWVQQPPIKNATMRQSLTTALIYRSLSDFLWLESNLRNEYHGAALVPRLDCYPINLSQPNPPPQALQDFLGDLLNGIRGQGEFYIPPDKILTSSSMEAFLYKSSLLQPPTPSGTAYSSYSNKRSPRDDLLQYLFVKPLELCGVRDGFFYSSRADDFSCGGESSLVTNSPTSTTISRTSQQHQRHHLASQDPPYSSSNAIHCELLEAESALCGQYASTTTLVLDHLRQLTQQEVVASQNWRRLATSLQMLFGYEKEAEGFKLEPHVKSPWRKISRPELDKSVQSLASCFARESAYDILIKMLQAFQGDLECIPLAMASYRSAVEDEDYQNDGKSRRDMLGHETWLRHSLTAFCRSTPIRTSRMAWRYWNTCASQCAAMASAASTLGRHIDFNTETVQKLKRRHEDESQLDRYSELDLVARIISIASKHEPSLIDDATHVEVDSALISENHTQTAKKTEVMDLAEQRVGRWDSKFSLAIMESLQVNNPSLEEILGRDLKRIRKYAIGLREHLNRCLECVKVLQSVLPSILEKRRHVLVETATLFSGKPMQNAKRSLSPSMTILARAGIDTTDPLGWSAAIPNAPRSNSVDRIGEHAVAYLNARDMYSDSMLDDIAHLLKEYYARVEVIEGYVYMECVGIQMERHFSQQRAAALSAFEKKTDLTAALNIANRKRLSKLKAELQEKLDKLTDVSHSVVKETKERHLESKDLKIELHELATRRLSRARETSTERVVQILSKWAKETESAAALELKALGEAMATLERAIGQEATLFYPPKTD